MILRRFRSLDELFHKVALGLLWERLPGIDWISSMSITSFDNVLIADSSSLGDIDLGWLGFTERRWPMFVQQYVDLPLTREWLATAAKAQGVDIPGLRFKEARHRLGGCLYGASYRNTTGPTIALHSRSSDITGAAIMDLTLASALAHELADRMEIDLTGIKIVWHTTAIFVGYLSALPLLAHLGIEKTLFRGMHEKNTRLLASVFRRSLYRGYQRAAFTDERPNWGRAVRVFEAYRRIKAGQDSVCRVADLRLPE